MCLNTINPGTPPDPVLVYKIFRRFHDNGEIFYASWFHHTYVRYHLGMMYMNQNDFPLALVGNSQTYRSGFHAYANVEAARKWACIGTEEVIVKVRLTNVTTSGTQDEDECYVAQTMELIEEVL